MRRHCSSVFVLFLTKSMARLWPTQKHFLSCNEILLHTAKISSETRLETQRFFEENDEDIVAWLGPVARPTNGETSCLIPKDLNLHLPKLNRLKSSQSLFLKTLTITYIPIWIRINCWENQPSKIYPDLSFTIRNGIITHD